MANQNLTLNNGKIAEYKGTDFWSRPFYKLQDEAGTDHIVCCINLNGTYLHYYSPRNDTDGEPDYSIPNSYQPIVPQA